MKLAVSLFAVVARLALVLVLGAAAARAEPSHGDAPYRTTAHFRFYGDEEVAPILDKLAATAEDRFTRLCRPIAACERVTRPIDIWVAEDAERFAAGFPEPSPMAEWAAGVTFLREQRVILRAHGTALLTLSETFDHELAHVLAHTYDVGQGRSVPRWFHEGLAIWQAGEGVLSRLETAVRAASAGQLLSYEELARAFPNEGKRVEIGYAQSALFVKRMVAEKGPAAVIGLLQDTGRGVPFETAFATRMGDPPEVVFARVSDSLEASSSPFVFLYDGNFLWAIMTLLFVAVAWMRLRDRKRQMARLADGEEQRIAAEDMALLAERTRPPPPIEHDEDGKPLLL